MQSYFSRYWVIGNSLWLVLFLCSQINRFYLFPNKAYFNLCLGINIMWIEVDGTGLSVADTEKGVLFVCIICKNESDSTRALPRSHATQYGIREEDVLPGSRVCNTCRCKSLRSRYTHCPLPSCPNSRGHRVKRLRPLPMKLPDLPRHIKDPIIAEFRKYTKSSINNPETGLLTLSSFRWLI